MKRILGILFSLVAAVLIVGTAPILMKTVSSGTVNSQTEESSILDQKILTVDEELHDVYKLYNSEQLVGVLTNRKKLDQLLDEIYRENYEDVFSNSDLSLGTDTYVVKERTYFNYEDIDDAILAYLKENNLFAVKTTVVEFADDNGIYAQCYVIDEELYQEAMNEYLSCFVDSSDLSLLNAGQQTAELKTYGSRTVGVSIQQTITFDEAYASPDEILMSKEEMLEFIEFGENPNKYYYTVEMYDTVAGVGSKNNGLTATQVMNLNRDQITSVDQVLSEGMQLCVSYFTPIFDVVVTMEKMTKEVVYPSTVYQEDESIRIGTTELLQAGINGSRNALYTERWVNGVLISGTLTSSVDTLRPVDEIVGIGSMEIPGVGTGVFRFPVDNPIISCGWGCYWGHEAIDLQNNYDRYGNIYASDRGVVEINTYDPISGNYIIINHNNGYRSYYGHMNVPSPLAVGTIVDKGDYIGQLGMTGYATGPHTHFYIEEDGIKLNPCNGFLDCTTMQ